MIALFVALGIAVVTLLALLLWFVPHLLQQQALHTAKESAKLREMLLDMLNEQEAVMLRQNQLGTSIAQLQEQLEQTLTVSHRPQLTSGETRTPAPDPAMLRQLESRISSMQSQIQGWLNTRTGTTRVQTEQDNESWAYLLSLLAAIQQRVGDLSNDRAGAAVTLHASTLLEELDQEMQHLRSISEDIATLQWRLRRSLNERENSISGLRTRTSASTD
ncbi:MAG: hypothetical protein MUD01_17030 [Chloroflexaceae bacterium]|jgi:hypothetical protein|nr:hypothetical protein [Chloroflexaceae bacterium]